MSVNFKTNVSNVPKGKSSSNFGILHPAKFNHYFNDFHEYNADDFEVIKVEGGTGSATTNIIDGDGGVLRIVTDDAVGDLVTLVLGDANTFKGSMRFNFNKDFFLKLRMKVSGFSAGNQVLAKAGMSWDMPTGAGLIDFIPCVATYLAQPFGILPHDAYGQLQTNNAGSSGNSSINLQLYPAASPQGVGGTTAAPVNLGANEWNLYEMYYNSKKREIRIMINGVSGAGFRVAYETSGNSDTDQPVNAPEYANTSIPKFGIAKQRWPDPQYTNDDTKYMSPFICIRNEQAGATKTLDIDYIWCGVEREGTEDTVL